MEETHSPLHDTCAAEQHLGLSIGLKQKEAPLAQGAAALLSAGAMLWHMIDVPPRRKTVVQNVVFA